MSDPYYNNVSLLLPMFGDNNGTTFTDYSPTPKTITRYGNTKTVTAESKYYGSSGYFDGTGDYLSLGDIHLDGSDWTVELWVRLSTIATTLTLLSQYNSAAAYRTMLDVRSGKLNVFNGSAGSVISATTMTVDQWHHVAYVHDSEANDCHMYLDGKLYGTHTTFVAPYSTTTLAATYLYRGTPSDSFSGHIQDLRITKGIARYTADFTPPLHLYNTYSVSGTITDDTGSPCARTVRLYDRATGAFIAETTSDASTGAYDFSDTFSDAEVQRIVLDDTAGTTYNDLIDRVIPG